MYLTLLHLGITAYFRHGVITTLWNKETGFLTYTALGHKFCSLSIPSEDQKIADISLIDAYLATSINSLEFVYT